VPADVDIVLPTRNTRDVTLRCLSSLLDEGTSQAAVTCTVYDNASDDGTADAIEARWPDVRVIRSETNAGYGLACNRAAAAGQAEYLLILNSDILARPGAVDRLLGFLREHPHHVAAGARLVEEGSDRPQVGFAVRAFPSLATQLALLTGLERFWPNNPVSRRHLMLDFDYERTQDVDGQPAGACLMCRRSHFDAIGGFDEAFYYWFEDVDLLRRLAERGPLAYVHNAVFEHLGGRTFSQWPRAEVVRTRYASLLRYFTKHHSRTEVAMLAAVVALLAVARAAPLVLVDRERAAGYRDVAGLAARHLAGLAPHARGAG
jgi:N-acetylglucosaminyl-diphospho-decaprenol L-rhamnosyltransferase